MGTHVRCRRNVRYLCVLVRGLSYFLRATYNVVQKRTERKKLKKKNPDAVALEPTSQKRVDLIVFSISMARAPPLVARHHAVGVLIVVGTLRATVS